MNVKDIIKSTLLFRLYVYSGEFWVRRDEKKRFFKEAKTRFESEKPQHGSFEDYKKAFEKHRVTYSEYMYSYEYWRLNEEQRDEFISTSEMQCIYRKLGCRMVREIFHNKVEFLTRFHQFIHRKWALAKDLSFEQFKAMIQQFDCIAKPIDGTRGDGIFKICADGVEDWETLYSKCLKDNVLLEECIRAYDEIAGFHPNSLNTIRVVTISNQDKCEVFGALFRMGAHGSIIDNTHAGGVYAPINVETGIIEIEAIDAQNHHYEKHPDTNKPIKGFKIPKWEQIVETCKKASRVIPDTHFAGWDLCINKDGNIEIIEGNHAPDFDGGMQAPLKIGVKHKMQQTVNRVMGLDPLPLISVWNNYNQNTTK